MRLRHFLHILRESILIEGVAEQLAKLRVKFIADTLRTVIPEEPLRQEVAQMPEGRVPNEYFYVYHSADTVFKLLIQADPSQQKKYMAWLMRWALSFRDQGLTRMHALVQEDQDKARQYLDVINRGRVRGFDINRVKTLGDLYQVVEPYLQVQTQGQVEKNERSKIDSETKVIYRGPEGMIVSPNTEEASCFWGKGTQWCTAATTSRNYFADYQKTGRLYIIMTNATTVDGKEVPPAKWQLHLPGGDFMDAADRRVDPKKFQQRYPWVVPALNLTPASILSAASVAWANLEGISDEEIEELLKRIPSAISQLSLSPNQVYNLIDENPELAQYAGTRILVLSKTWGQDRTMGLISRHPEVSRGIHLPAIAEAGNWDPQKTIALIQKNPHVLDSQSLIELSRQQKWPSQVLIDLVVNNPRLASHEMIKSWIGTVPNADIEKVLKEFPDLGMPEILYAMSNRKMTKRILKAISDQFEEHGNDVPQYDPKTKLFLLKQYKTCDDALEDIFGSDSIVYRILRTDNSDFFDHWQFDARLSDVEYMFGELPDFLKNAIIAYTKATYPDDIDYDDADDNDIVRILDDNNDEAYSAIRNGIETGWQYGAENEAYEAARRVLDDTLNGDLMLVQMDPPNMDGPMNVYVTVDGLVNHLDELVQGDGLREVFELEDAQEPYNGWSGTDEDAAIERAMEDMPPEVDGYIDATAKAAYEKKNLERTKAISAKYEERSKQQIAANLAVLKKKPPRIAKK